MGPIKMNDWMLDPWVYLIFRTQLCTHGLKALWGPHLGVQIPNFPGPETWPLEPVKKLMSQSKRPR